MLVWTLSVLMLDMDHRSRGSASPNQETYFAKPVQMTVLVSNMTSPHIYGVSPTVSKDNMTWRSAIETRK